MRRHSNWFNAGLTKNLDKFTRYSNGTGNVEVVKKRLGENKAYAENGNIKNSNLRMPFAIAEILEFEKPINREIKDKLFGKSKNNTPNFYFLVKFAYRNQIYKGWIKEVSLNNPAKWKLIIYNDGAN